MFVRFSLSRPREEHRDEALSLEDQLLAFFVSQPGYLDGYRLAGSDQVGRVTFWETEAAADQASSATHTQALRSRLMQIIEPGAQELGLEGQQARRA